MKPARFYGTVQGTGQKPVTQRGTVSTGLEVSAQNDKVRIIVRLDTNAKGEDVYSIYFRESTISNNPIKLKDVAEGKLNRVFE